MSNFNKIKSQIFLPTAIVLSITMGVLISKIYYKNLGFIGRFTGNSKENKLNTILKFVENNYVDKVSMDSLQEIAVSSFLEQLDPHTVYLNPQQAKQASEELLGNFEGIGIQFNVFKDTIFVVKTIENGPSFYAGILAGDRIVNVNDSLVAGVGIKNDEVMKLLKGTGGTIVKLSIKRRSLEEPIEITVKRGQIPLQSIDASYILKNKEIGYIKISSFSRNTYYDFRNKLLYMKENGVKSVIVDLRDNGGGYLESAVNMLDEFFTSGSTIVVTKGKTSGKRTIKSTNAKQTFSDIKLVVLINEFSASASEIFAGAIQDNDRGFIIGRRSFGKGLVQEEVKFDDGSVLRLTVSRYYTPSGRCIQKPYSKGKNDYNEDILNRYIHGEFSYKDSIIYNDTTSYFTLSGRKVFGGGGIMPDIFVPVDTSTYSKMLAKINEKNLCYNFALQFVDDYRQNLKSVTKLNDLNNFIINYNTYQKFWNYVRDNKIQINDNDLYKSKTYIENLVKAYIARQILSEDDFYQVFNSNDKTMDKAVEVIVKKQRLF